MGKHRGHKVAVKVLRVYSTSDFNNITSVGHHPSLAKSAYGELMIIAIAQMFCKEVVVWKSLHHPNVLPLLGVTMGKRLFAMVSEWMINGNINEFVEAHRDVNRFELVGSHSHNQPHRH